MKRTCCNLYNSDHSLMQVLKIVSTSHLCSFTISKLFLAKKSQSILVVQVGFQKCLTSTICKFQCPQMNIIHKKLNFIDLELDFSCHALDLGSFYTCPVRS